MTRWRLAALICVICAAGLACASAKSLPPGTVEVPAGAFQMGSSLDERASAIETTRRSEPSQTDTAVSAVKREFRRSKVELSGFRIMKKPVTQREYLHFVRATGAPEPYVDRRTWEREGTDLDYAVVQRFLWHDGTPPPARMDHPVVLVSQLDAAAYCRWWGEQFGQSASLPSEAQWEKSARGTDGRAYPWGNRYDARRLNSRDSGVGDTSPAGSYAESASPYGVVDMAGNVFEWTRTRIDPKDNRYVVKGGAWNSDGASARAAARHARPQWTRHVSIGFRCVVQ